MSTILFMIQYVISRYICRGRDKIISKEITVHISNLEVYIKSLISGVLITNLFCVSFFNDKFYWQFFFFFFNKFNCWFFQFLLICWPCKIMSIIGLCLTEFSVNKCVLSYGCLLYWIEPPWFHIWESDLTSCIFYWNCQHFHRKKYSVISWRFIFTM